MRDHFFSAPGRKIRILLVSPSAADANFFVGFAGFHSDRGNSTRAAAPPLGV